jgi:predicted ATPase/DNA-binding XRE family transcriptional regulator
MIIPAEFANSIGDILKYLRKKAGLTQRQLAETIGSSPALISRFESNERMPSIGMLRGLILPTLKVDDPVLINLIVKRVMQLKIDSDNEIEISSSQHISSTLPDSAHFTSDSSANHSSLPISPYPIFGREQAIAEIAKIFNQHYSRLITITGPPGVGKTRVALEFANRFASFYEDTVYLVSLGSVTSAENVDEAIASACNLSQSKQTYLRQCIQFFRNKQALLVLDNFEHVISAAPMVELLLNECIELHILITSRQLLKIKSEYGIALPPLSPEDALKLLSERLRHIAPAVKLDEQQLPSVRIICKLLDHLPLAIELHAPRLLIQSPQEILYDIQRGVFLDNTKPWYSHLPERQQSLSKSILWSYDLLTINEKKALCYLAVFQGEWTREMVIECFAKHIVDFAKSLQLLVRNHLVVAFRVGTEWQYSLLATIRAFALQRLEACGETHLAKQIHAEYYHHQIRQMYVIADSDKLYLHHIYLQNWEKTNTFIRTTQRDWANYSAAFEWFLQNDLSQGLDAIGRMWWRWERASRIAEGTKWLTRYITAVRDTDTKSIQWHRGYASCLLGQGLINIRIKNLPQAYDLLNESLTIFEKLDDEVMIANCKYPLGQVVMWMNNDLDRAERLLLESVTVFKQYDLAQALVWSLAVLHKLYIRRKDFEKAETTIDECVTYAHMGKNPHQIAWMLCLNGEFQLATNLQEKAIEKLNNALKIAVESFEESCIIYINNVFATIAWRSGDYDAMMYYLEIALNKSFAIGFNFEIVIGYMGIIAAINHFYPIAAKFWGKSHTTSLSFGDILPLNLKTRYCQLKIAVQAKLTHEFSSFWNQGSQLTNEQAYDMAIDLLKKFK